MLKRDKKGTGLVTGLIIGIGALVIMTIISLVIVDTINNTNLFTDASSDSVQEANLTDTSTTLTDCNTQLSQGFNPTVTSLTVTNDTLSTVPNTNYTYSTTACTISITEQNFGLNETNVNVTYSISYDANTQAVVNKMVGNYTEGIDNVSGKLPTILLIAAVVLLFGAIVLLVQRSKQMGGGSEEV